MSVDEDVNRLKTDMTTVKGALFGVGETNGVRGRVARLERDMYANPQTGEKGIVADMHEIKKLVTGMRAAFWVMNFFLGSGLALAAWRLLGTSTGGP